MSAVSTGHRVGQVTRHTHGAQIGLGQAPGGAKSLAGRKAHGLYDRTRVPMHSAYVTAGKALISWPTK